MFQPFDSAEWIIFFIVSHPMLATPVTCEPKYINLHISEDYHLRQLILEIYLVDLEYYELLLVKIELGEYKIYLPRFKYESWNLTCQC